MAKKKQEEETDMWPMYTPYMYPPMMPPYMPQDPKLNKKLEEVIRSYEEDRRKKKKSKKKHIRGGLTILETALMIYVATWPLAYLQQYITNYFQTLINGLH